MSVRMALGASLEKTVIVGRKSHPNCRGQGSGNYAVSMSAYTSACRAPSEALYTRVYVYMCTRVSLSISYPHNSPATGF